MIFICIYVIAKWEKKLVLNRSSNGTFKLISLQKKKKKYDSIVQIVSQVL